MKIEEFRALLEDIVTNPRYNAWVTYHLIGGLAEAMDDLDDSDCDFPSWVKMHDDLYAEREHLIEANWPFSKQW